MWNRYDPRSDDDERGGSWDRDFGSRGSSSERDRSEERDPRDVFTKDLDLPRGRERRPELGPRTLCTFLRELSSPRRTPHTALQDLSGVSEEPMIISMTTTSRPQQRYDHRLRDLVQRTGDLTIATNLGVPRSTARGWLGAPPRVVVSLEVADLTEPELRQEILRLRRRLEKLAALLRLARGAASLGPGPAASLRV